jgi:4-diphosphocytidyl-2-C-methyl-D-erythritol kinase
MNEVRIPAFAKINVRLDVLGRRPDGFHELRTIFQAVSLHDDLILRRTRGPGVTLQVEGDAALSREPVEKNLVYRAVHLLRRALRVPGGVAVTLRKKIPAGRGLGGGSSDAAAALLGYLRLSGKTLGAGPLMELAASLGADVPFFLFGGRALGIGKGDEIYPLPDVATRHLLVVSPREIHVPTPEAYTWLAARPLYRSAGPANGGLALTKAPKASKIWEFCALTWSAQVAGSSGDFANDFEGPVFLRHPRLRQIKRVLLENGALEASLAGSGSAVFGVFPSPATARRAAVRFPHDQTFVCETISRRRYLRAVSGARVR